MRYRSLGEAGSAHLIAAGVIIVLSVVTLAGWRVVSTQHTKSQARTTQLTNFINAPAEIHSTTDLQQADDALSSDQNSDNSLSGSPLDADINSTL